MKAFKTTTLAALAALPLIAPSSSNAAAISYYGDINLGLTFEQSAIESVSGIPFDVRNVPRHKRDGGEFPGAIKDVSLEPGTRLTIIKSKIGAETSIFGDRIPIRAGVGFDFNFNTLGVKEPNKRSDMIERNYADGSDRRGTGSALTYLQAGTGYLANGNKFFRPNLFVATGYKFNPNWTVMLEGRVHQESLFLETGWDRFDELDEWKRHDVAKYTIVSPSISIEYQTTSENEKVRPYISFTIGTQKIVSERETSLGKSVNVKKGSGVFAGFVFGAAW